MKHHCVFCGLNGDAMDFRIKPPERMLAEIRELVDLWNPDRLTFTDNIMPLGYLQTVLPELASWETRPSLFYEVKANLKFEQLDLMRKAGMVQIQPGIESLSSNVLKLMRKGVSAMQNLMLLRDCTSLGIFVLWNLLYGFPGETTEDYAPLPDLFASIEHLRPPQYCVPIVIDRFSPHHRDPQAFGIDSYLPYPGFAALFPPGSPVMDLAYHFIGQHSTAFMSDGDLLGAVHDAYDVWHAQWQGRVRAPVLTALDIGPDAPVVIADTRRVATARMTSISRACDDALRVLEKPRRLESLDPQVAAFVPMLLQNRFVIEHEGLLLSVVTRPRPVSDAAGQAPQARAAVPTIA